MPNIIFDITGKNEKSIYEITEELTNVGYDANNVNIVWVLSNYEVAKEANRTRERVVPEAVLMDAHFGTAKTMSKLIFKNLDKSLINGDVYVILNNREETKFHKGTKVVKDFTYLQVKKSNSGVSMSNENKEKMKRWIEENTPKSPELFKPKISESDNKFHEIDKIKFSSNLYVVITDADPYDALTYFLNNKAIAMEYVSNYRKRISDIKDDVEGFIKKLKEF